MKGMGGVFSHCTSHKNETLQHFFTKLMILKILQEKNRKALIEQNIGYGIVDCYDYTNSIAYECEPRIDAKKLQEKYKKYSLGGAKDVIIVPYEELWKLLDLDEKRFKIWKKAIEERIQ